MRSGGCAGSGRALRLDPFGLPVRFYASDAVADGQVRDVELHRKRVVLRRSLHGMRMALNMPVAAFDGVSLRLVPGEGGAEDALAVVLKHRDPALTLPLFVTSQPGAALDEWRAWSQVLGVPLLLAEKDAGARAPNAQLGELHIERPRPRRRRRNALKKRRPSILLRRGHAKSPRRRRSIVASARSSRGISSLRFFAVCVLVTEEYALQNEMAGTMINSQRHTLLQLAFSGVPYPPAVGV
ncbi:MAG: DUF6101 family protein [Pseudolabrys sp.]